MVVFCRGVGGAHSNTPLCHTQGRAGGRVYGIVLIILSYNLLKNWTFNLAGSLRRMKFGSI